MKLTKPETRAVAIDSSYTRYFLSIVKCLFWAIKKARFRVAGPINVKLDCFFLLQSDKKRDSTTVVTNEIVSCTSCGPNPCTHTANNGCAAEVTIVLLANDVSLCNKVFFILTIDVFLYLCISHQTIVSISHYLIVVLIHFRKNLYNKYVFAWIIVSFFYYY